MSRSLAACEGALLVIDAAQGIEAQTLANLYLAVEADLAIIPVINKIDLPSAQPDKVKEEIERVIGLPADDAILASAKEGIGIHEILEAIVKQVPPPHGDPDTPLTALVFDSKYDPYKGVIAYVRVADGAIKQGQKIQMMATGSVADVLEVGYFNPHLIAAGTLTAGEVGYVATGFKNVKDCRVGDTITSALCQRLTRCPAIAPPSRWSMRASIRWMATTTLSCAMRWNGCRLNDAALVYTPESSLALGFGFRCGFLGLLHMEIIQERLEREYRLNLLATAPSVEYIVTQNDRRHGRRG